MGMSHLSLVPHIVRRHSLRQPEVPEPDGDVTLIW